MTENMYQTSGHSFTATAAASAMKHHIKSGTSCMAELIKAEAEGELGIFKSHVVKVHWTKGTSRVSVT